jgi:hypothetical protein
MAHSGPAAGHAELVAELERLRPLVAADMAQHLPLMKRRIQEMASAWQIPDAEAGDLVGRWLKSRFSWADMMRLWLLWKQC